MTETDQENVLHLPVVLEARDYFRYYLDRNRMKFVIGLVIYAVMTSALIYFFAFIGEQEMLLETSPLFLGAPAVAIIGQLLRAHASTRKYIADLSESERILRFTFREHADSYDVARGDNLSHIAWSSIRLVAENRRYFEISFNKYDSLIIPKRFFAGGKEENIFREILRSQLGNRARLSELTEG